MQNEFHGLWRALANDAVPNDDFPHPLVVLPEWIDGALGAGEASTITIAFDITTPTRSTLTVHDNGKGLVSLKRMMDWSSKDTGNSRTENIYGRGSKIPLSKFNPEYTTSDWKLHWRKQDRRGVSGCLNTLHSPFLGQETRHTEDEDNMDICPDHGTQWNITFDLSVLGACNTPAKIMQDLQEIIRSRFEPEYYKPYEIITKIVCGTETLVDSSSKWTSLRQTLENELSSGKVVKTHQETITIGGCSAKVSMYYMVPDGRTYHLQGMPTYGKKNMNSSRIHLARNGRYIEAMPYDKFMGKETHNSGNGNIGFVLFEGDELPTPCTIKVKFRDECPVFKRMVPEIVKYLRKPIAKAPDAQAPKKADKLDKVHKSDKADKVKTSAKIYDAHDILVLQTLLSKYGEDFPAFVKHVIKLDA